MSESCFTKPKAEIPMIRDTSRWRFAFPQVRLLVLGALLSLGLGCGGNEKNSAPEELPVRPKASGIATPPLKVGDLLPPLQAEGWLNGAPPAPNAQGVRLMVVDVWGVWCPYCSLSAPGLGRVYQKYSGQGVGFVSITNMEREVVEGYVRQHSVPWSNGYGATVQMISALGAGSGMVGPADYEVAPTLYLVGPDGRIRWVDGRGRARHQDPREWEKAVDAAVAEQLNSPEKP
ncbi:MAG: TlpA family protein disulfide reductase [Planctomycetia bacterium]|nr:TlpA family protein disulfide reductase [Planctomycetia bacterium]